MKVNFFILIILFLFFILANGCSEDTTEFSRYPYKSGKIIFENTVQTTTIRQILYFEDFGAKEAISSSINMNGDEVLMKSIYKDGYSYTTSNTSDHVGKTAIDRNAINHLGFFTITPKMLEEAKAVNKGKETISGRPCDMFSIKNDDYDMDLWVWKNIIIKLVSRYRGSIMTRTVKEIEEKNNLPTSLFEVPSK